MTGVAVQYRLVGLLVVAPAGGQLVHQADLARRLPGVLDLPFRPHNFPVIRRIIAHFMLLGYCGACRCPSSASSGWGRYPAIAQLPTTAYSGPLGYRRCAVPLRLPNL